MSDTQKKLGTQLLQLVRPDLLPQGRNKDDMMRDLQKRGMISMNMESEITANVYIKLKPKTDLNLLTPYVVQITNADTASNLVAAKVDINNLEALAEIDMVKSIQLVIPPVVNGGIITSEGDIVLRADLVRLEGSVDGSGIKVGIISDVVDNCQSSIPTIYLVL